MAAPPAWFVSAGLFATACGATAAAVATGFGCGAACLVSLSAGLSVTGLAGRFSVAATFFAVLVSVLAAPPAWFPSAGLLVTACGDVAAGTAGFDWGDCGAAGVVPVATGLSAGDFAGRFSCFAVCVPLLLASSCRLVSTGGVDGCLLPSASGFARALLSPAAAFWLLVFRFCPDERLRPPRRPRLAPRFC